jgi:hypothetical protein
LPPEVTTEKLPGGKTRYGISATEEKAQEIMQRIEQKHKMKNPNSDLKIETGEPLRSTYSGRVKILQKLGGTTALRSVCKTAIDFYLYAGGDPQYVGQSIPYVVHGNGRDRTTFYYPDTDVLTDRDADQILHAVIAQGDPDERILYSYIEFFSGVRYITLLNDNYAGEKFTKSYFFDVLRNIEVNKEFSLNISRDSLQTLLAGSAVSAKQLELALHNLMRIGMSRRDNDRFDAIIQDAMKDSLERYPEGVPITREMMGEFIDELIKRIIPLLPRENDLLDSEDHK